LKSTEKEEVLLSIANGIKPYFWDTGDAIDRRNNAVLDQGTIDAITAGAN
jgi:hypothetical protein